MPVLAFPKTNCDDMVKTMCLLLGLEQKNRKLRSKTALNDEVLMKEARQIVDSFLG